MLSGYCTLLELMTSGKTEPSAVDAEPRIRDSGKQTGCACRGSPKSRRAARGSRPIPPLLDRLPAPPDNLQTNPGTIPTHYRASDTIPSHYTAVL